MILLAAALIALLYPLILAAIVMASFMAAWDTHYFLSFVYLGLTAFALPWWRSERYKAFVGHFLTLQGCLLFWVALVATVAK